MEQKIRHFCQQLGLDTVGFIPVRRYDELEAFYKTRVTKGLQNPFEEAVLEKRLDPRCYMATAKTILVVAFPYDDKVRPASGCDGFSIYTQRADYHQVVKGYLEKIRAYIQTLGGEALPLVDSHGLPERYMAYLAGVGFIGRNQMLITKKYGSYVFLGELLIDQVIPCEEVGQFEAIGTYTACGHCRQCLSACPTRALREDVTNSNVCVSYLTQKKEITQQEARVLKGRLFGCDTCQMACPYNREVEPTPLACFQTQTVMQQLPEVYAAMDNPYFKQHIAPTSCGWRGKNVIRRNALIAMADKGQAITPFKGDSPYINHYITLLSPDDGEK